MRWPFRRSPSPDSSTNSGADPVEASNPATDTAQAAPAPESGAWRDLPAGLPVLGAMPSATDPGFSRSLPSRWHNPPALGPLGHEVRTDVPGGLVSGAARTVDPLDTRPADFVWRVPDAADQATAADQEIRALTQATAARTVTAPTTATTAVAREGSGADSSQIVSRARQSQAAQNPLVPVISQTSVPSPGNPARSDADTGAATGAPASPGGGTTQTRQALPDAVTAVEARDPRPVPADVTDGPTAAAPDRGVTAEPRPGTLQSPPEAPRTGFGSLLTPREARPGPDPRGSAPAVAPLVSRGPLPRASAGPLVGGQGATDRGPRPAGAAATEPSNTDFSVPPGRPDGRPLAAKQPPQDGSPTSDTESDPDTDSGTYPAFPDSGEPPNAVHINGTQGPDTSAESAAPAATAASPAAVSDQAARPVGVRMAPLVSASRSGSAAARISVLQPPSAPVDQPVRKAESVIGGFAIASPATVAPSPATPAAPLAPEAAVMQTAAARAMTASATAADSAMRATGPLLAQPQNISARTTTGIDRSAAALQAAEGAANRVARPGAIGETGAPNASPSMPTAAATAVTPHDPAALDTLARQLYGRLSRHLAGELLIDRERSHLLTDLH